MEDNDPLFYHQQSSDWVPAAKPLNPREKLATSTAMKGLEPASRCYLKVGWCIMTGVCGERATPQLTSTKKKQQKHRRTILFLPCDIVFMWLVCQCFVQTCLRCQTFSTWPFYSCVFLFVLARKRLQKLFVCPTISPRLPHGPDCLHSFVNIVFLFFFFFTVGLRISLIWHKRRSIATFVFPASFFLALMFIFKGPCVLWWRKQLVQGFRWIKRGDILTQMFLIRGFVLYFL